MNKVITIAIGLVLSVLASFAQVPQSDHVFVVMEENHGYSSVVGSSSMPYLNSLAQRYGLATQYYANTHPSIGNYFMLTTGQILTNNDGYTSTVTSDNLVRHFLNAGKTWKSYAEGLPSVGYTGGDTGYYLEHHNPFSYFSDVRNSSNEKLNLVPFGQFQTDLNNGQLPNFSYIVPNIMHDAHDGSLAAADQWLQQNIAPVLSSSAFQQDGLMIIVFDESADTDTTHGGGHVAMLVISPKGKSGYKSSTTYQHQSTLKLIMEALGMSDFPGAAASAPDMSEFFGSTSSATPTATTALSSGSCAASSTGVRVCSPVNGQTVSSPVQILAGATSGAGITTMQVYVDDQLRYTVHSSSIDTSLSMSTGQHSVVVQAWDNSGKVYKTPVSVTVGSSSSPSGSCSASSTGVKICSPTNGSTTGSPVQITAAAAAAAGISTMKIYVDDNDSYTIHSNSLNTALSMGSGSHNIVVQAWDNNGRVYKTPVQITVSGSSQPSPTPTSCGASSGVTFCTPTSGSTTSTSVQVSAAGASYITAIALYLDSHDPYVDFVHSTKLTTTLNVSAGSHNLALVGWDSAGHVYQKSINFNAGGSSSPSSGLPSPPSNAIVISSIQKQSGWQTCGNCGNEGASGTAPSYNLTQWISNPSLSGAATDFYISGPAFTGGYYMIDQPIQGRPVTYLKYEFDLYIPSAYANTPQAIEFECQQTVNGYTYNFAWQADYASNTWRVFNYTTKNWESTGVSLQRFTPGTWHHIIALYHASGTSAVHDSLTVDGTTHKVNIWHSATHTGYGTEFSNAFQLDLNGSGTAYKVYVDNMKVTVAD